MEPRLDDPLHIVVAEERAIPAGSEEREPGDVHVHAGLLQVEEARVEPRQSLRGHPPMLGSGAMRRLATALALAAPLLMMPGPAEAQDPADEASYGASVSAIDNLFTPEIVRIDPGETVEWTVDGRSAHTVDADDGSWSSGNLDPGAGFDRTFDAEGIFPFFCRYHGRPGLGMAGTIVVGDAPLPGGGVPGPDPLPPDLPTPCMSPMTPRRSRKRSTAPAPAASS